MENEAQNLQLPELLLYTVFSFFPYMIYYKARVIESMKTYIAVARHFVT